MDEKSHEKLIQDTEALRDLLAQWPTSEAVHSCSVYLFEAHRDSDTEERLMSPYRQVMLLLGMLMGTPEPTVSPKWEDWIEVRRLLNRVFFAYAQMFLQSAVEASGERWRTIEVSSGAFLHYFNQGLLISVEQVEHMYEQLLARFDPDLAMEIGFGATEALRVVRAIRTRMEARANHLHIRMREALEAKEAFLGEAASKGWGLEEMRRNAKGSRIDETFRRMIDAIDQHLSVKLDELQEDVGNELGARFWDLFAVKRGLLPRIHYLTEENECNYRPIYLLDAGRGLCLSVNTLYLGTYSGLARILQNGPRREAFLTCRDEVLELRGAKALQQFFGNEAQVFVGSSETPDRQHEHDAVVLWNRRLFVVEAKASPPREPFRDPDKAYVRLRDAFRGKKGIQGAFEQASRLRSRWRRGETIELHGAVGKLQLSVDPKDLDEVYCICLTADDFGLLAVDLSLLLEKPEDVPFPWAVNINDLETLLQGWKRRRWGPAELCSFLDERAELHGRIIADDELDVAGAFMQHGTFKGLLAAGGDRILFTPEYSSIFDEIAAEQDGGPASDFTITEPVITDVREGVAKLLQEPPSVHPRARKIGRNEPCPCRSGKKYKKCCGR